MSIQTEVSDLLSKWQIKYQEASSRHVAHMKAHEFGKCACVQAEMNVIAVVVDDLHTTYYNDFNSTK